MNFLSYISLSLSGCSTSFSVLLAASAQSSCTALVCSCYAPSRDFNKEGEESSGSQHNRKRAPAEKKDWAKEEVPCYNELQGQGNNNGHMEPHALKSNLKKATEPEDNQFKAEKRKVSWPDAHGKDIAHVHEFETSVYEEGELEGVRNSCICAIQ